MISAFGELLLRFSPSLNRKWIHDAITPVYVGGAELNVAAALACWGLPVQYCTRLPNHSLSREIISELQENNIEVSIEFGGDRIGTYYLPQGSDLKNEGVIYDRAHSAFWELESGMMNWQKILKASNHFHFSAISPALNQQVADACVEAVIAAKSKSIPVSIDLNYRAKLWQYGKQPPEVMHSLVQHADIVMGNIWAAEQLLHIPSTIESSQNKTKDELITAALKSIELLKQKYKQVKTIAYTFRLNQTYFAVLQHQGQTVVSHEFSISQVVDKVGSGDCFMAGLLFGIYEQQTPQEIVDFAASAAVGKMQELGDHTKQTVMEILNRLQS
ncbi:MAG TPA: sugar kinase [Sediminibacterium sp.]|uniref:sugar kinase n=1 Tax=Sediminibacterium sp. TaxID=1917865 RepID=UPI0008AE72F2|nr:sugar kinase [Sediminibacterium sp.]OHC86341.1 MAG: carbohydrate kinase [Sphingobacteriia bacterium RIFOXYC2_FULL_35_18]OHC89853.1 MAG: carbohydrate kinase [Sphingobacteriia bacterium RIFOXYD2_FULL_35_12]HLD54243.1 sugar kinase [Sediminibacterium sp.]